MVKNHSVTQRTHQPIQKHVIDDIQVCKKLTTKGQVRKFSKAYDKKNYYFQLLVVFVGSGCLFIVG